MGARSSTEGLDFVEFLGPHFEAVRRSLAARFGTEIGAEVAADVLAWAWEHQEDVRRAENPSGYLFRVGQSRARRYLRWRRAAPADLGSRPAEASADPALHAALERLRPRQRTIVVLVHALGLSYAEAAAHIGVSEGTVRNQLHRAMARLRSDLDDGGSA